MMRKLALKVLAAFSAVVLVCDVGQAAPVCWDANVGGNGHSYEVWVVSRGISWQAAKLAAEASGGHLAVITSAAENDFVFSLANSVPGAWAHSGINTLGPWLGGTDSAVEGKWEWVTGEAFSYENWGASQPSLNGDYLNLYGLSSNRGKLWNDYQNSVPSYVVEYVPEPVMFSLLGVGGLMVFRRRKA